MASAATCGAFVHSGYMSPEKCGKPAKGTLRDGTPACGVHLAGERRRIATDERHAAEWKAAAERKARREGLAALLIAADVDARPAGYVEREEDAVVLTEAGVRTILNRFAEAEQEIEDREFDLIEAAELADLDRE